MADTVANLDSKRRLHRIVKVNHLTVYTQLVACV